MNSRIRIALQVGVASVALVTGALASGQGITGRLGGKAREQAQAQEQRAESSRSSSSSGSASSSSQRSSSGRSDNQRSQGSSSRGAQPSRSEQPARTAQPARPAPDRGNSRAAPRAGNERPSWQETPRQSAPRQTPPVLAAPAQPSSSSGSRNSGSTTNAPASGRSGNSGSSNRDADRGVLGTLIQREYQTGGDRDRDDRDGRDRGNDRDDRDRGDRGNDRGNDRDYDGRDRDRDRYGGRRDRDRHVHVIHHLPAGYRDYVWNGTHYYYHGGYWYRPQGSTYISVSLPLGLFVNTLPGSYTSVWIGGTRYYYSDYHYYVYEPVRRGYVVVESPYDDEDDYRDSGYGQDLFIYPAAGQSEQQQADDRYDCHRWAVDQTGYDPIDDEYDADLRADYLRAMTACLTGRGYTVR